MRDLHRDDRWTWAPLAAIQLRQNGHAHAHSAQASRRHHSLTVLAVWDVREGRQGRRTHGQTPSKHLG